MISKLIYNPRPINVFFSSYFSPLDDHSWWPSQIFDRPIQDTRPKLLVPSTNADGSISIRLEVPGFGKEDITIEFNEETGTLLIASKTEDTATNTFPLRHSFTYKYGLNTYIDPETIEAVCSKGVLSVSAVLFKKVIKPTRPIEIK